MFDIFRKRKVRKPLQMYKLTDENGVEYVNMNDKIHYIRVNRKERHYEPPTIADALRNLGDQIAEVLGV